MAIKEQQRQIYRTARGRELDMNKLINQNELTIAVGNAKVNARGDKLGPNGEIIKRREDILREANQQPIPDQISVRPQPAPAPVATAPTKSTPVKVTKDVSGMDPEGNE
jgi:hypothetical protein